MKNISRRIPVLFIVVFFVFSILSCEKEVHINLNSGEPNLVVEGTIETDLPPYLFLTKSIGFLSKIDLATLEGSFVHGAVVKVSDGVTTIQLKEYSLDTGGTAKFYFYSVDTADANSLNFKGKINTSYSLSIDYDGKNYTAITTIPNPKPLDSLWIQKPDEAQLEKVPDGRLVYFKYTDPDTIGNNVRYFTQRNDEIFYPGIGSVYDDQIVNGGTIKTNLNLGFDRSKSPNFDSLGLAFLGDTVIVKWCSIDRGVFKFWDSYEYSIGTVGSPFSSPINLRSNIIGGALGIWAGYGATFRGIKVKD
jgi:hypothetical protein